MATTPNYQLYVEDSDQVSFKSWRQNLCGATSSNMTKIDAELARKSSKDVAFNVTLRSNGWSNSQQTISSDNFKTKGYSYTVTPATANYEEYANSGVYAMDITSDRSLTFKCRKTPSNDLQVRVIRSEVVE